MKIDFEDLKIRHAKIIFLSGNQILGFKNVRTIYLEIISKYMVINMEKLVFISNLFSGYQSKILTNCIKSFEIWKISRFFSKNVWELDYQVVNFLHVCLKYTYSSISITHEDTLMTKKIWKNCPKSQCPNF